MVRGDAGGARAGDARHRHHGVRAHRNPGASRSRTCCALRDFQDETGLFTAFIPWTFQPANTALGGQAAGAHDYLRTLAISRLVLDNVPNLQASWVTQGAKVAQLSLAFGANDLGSTMLEENVVRAAGVTFRLSKATRRPDPPRGLHSRDPQYLL